MSTGEKKPAIPPATSPPSTPPPTKGQGAAPAQDAKTSILSRRTFLKVAMAASIAATSASLLFSYVNPASLQLGGILDPLIPKPKGPMKIMNATDLETTYDGIRGQTGQVASQFFYWPYDASASPYYKNALVRIPDEILDPSVRGSSPNLAHYECWNLTCVHLRCIVNPRYDSTTEQPRLKCPCHGSQYLLTTAVPVAGPAYDLGLRPLPRIVLSLDSQNNIIAERFDGEPGIGRTD